LKLRWVQKLMPTDAKMAARSEAAMMSLRGTGALCGAGGQRAGRQGQHERNDRGRAAGSGQAQDRGEGFIMSLALMLRCGGGSASNASKQEVVPEAWLPWERTQCRRKARRYARTGRRWGAAPLYNLP
jgi:hypothetical protein